MIEVSSGLIKKAVYNLCFKANTCLNDDVYLKILGAYNTERNEPAKNHLKNILQNAKTAYEKKLPLCQDTGQVVVFLEIGQEVIITGGFIEDEINSAVKECYSENFFRKSTVKNSVFDRTNTGTNTPCIIYTKFIKGGEIKIKVLIKGAGSENKSQSAMLMPSDGGGKIIKKCCETALKAGFNACPPLFIGIGASGTIDKSFLMSKEAFIETDFTDEEKALAEKIKKNINDNAPDGFKNCFVLDVKIKTGSTHIACLPLAVTINCHSDRYSSAYIKNGEIIYEHKTPDFKDFPEENTKYREIKTGDIEALKSVKIGETVLLTGEIYTARDAAHKKIIELIKDNKPLPFDLKDKIIFYAGPCPAPEGFPAGSTGPTTASRMDKYAVMLYEKGIYASIGKGERSLEVKEYCIRTGRRYFTIQGGIAAMLAEKIKDLKIIAFPELGTEAVHKLRIEKLPIKAEI